MTLEELWELFPIFLVKLNRSKWSEEYEMMLNVLTLIDLDLVENIHHIGSTIINGI